MSNYRHPGPASRAASAAIRESLNAATPVEREARLSLALVKIAEAFDAIAAQYHGK
jgi:hypothetical protein